MRAAAPIALWIALWLLPGCDGAVPADAPPRNLILVSLDTLRADHLGVYGYPRATSPRLDAFAARGAVFRDAVSASSWTVPAHATLFTSLEPPAHGLVEFPRPGRLAAEHRLLAEILRDAGLRTAAITGGGFLSPRHGFARGFEAYQVRGRRLAPKLAAARTWLDSLAPDERFFLFLHGFGVHRPYRPPGGGFAPLDPPPRAARLAEDLAVLVRTATPERPVARRPTESELAWVVAQYDGEIAWLDAALGDFLADLDRAGRLADTLVVVVSDHGEEFYEHGAIDHVRTLYRELLHVAWILVGPRVPAGVVTQPVGLVDVLPTVLELMEIPAPAGAQGQSRVPLLAQAGPPPTSEAAPIFSFTAFSDFPYAAASVHTRRWKLIRWSRDGTAEQLAATPTPPWYTHLWRGELDDRIELFDRERDPSEQRDVAARHPDVVARLLRALDARVAESRAGGGAPVPARPPDAEEIEALRSLGYLE